MKLVLSFSISDSFSCSSNANLPFEYESKEKAELDLLDKWEIWAKVYYSQKSGYVDNQIIFAGLTLDLIEFTSRNQKTKLPQYNQPQILTLEEWCEQNRPK